LIGVVGKSSSETSVTVEFSGAGVFGKATKFSAKCGKEPGMASDNSGVESTIVAFDTLRQ
jgi:hypothetical protein